MSMESGLSGFGRFSEPALVSLVGGSKHGYAMMEDIAAFAGLRVGAGTLYGTLARLEERGLIAPLPTEEWRRPYRLTATGLAVREERFASLDTVARVGRRRLAVP